MSNPFLDYSQYKDFTFCEWKWYEKVIEQTRKRPKKEGQRNDVLTLGSLVHAGLEFLRREGRLDIPETAIAEFEPTPECLSQARRLLLGYIQTYPNEGQEFAKYYVERALRFPLVDGVDGLAKIDSYFRLDEPTTLSNGLGNNFMLSPGWWIKEYKTKDASRDLGSYVESWRVNMQPAFQILALQELIGESVQGMLVDVLEKPKTYVPRRTCKACHEVHSLQDWLATGDGYMCPTCDNVQELDTSDKSKVERKPVYYRLAVSRNRDELEQAKIEMERVAFRMQELWDGGIPGRATERCVDFIFGPCEYFQPHAMLRGAAGWSNDFVPVEAFQYIKEL